MIHHPSKRYIYYLISRRDKSTEQILRHLQELDLPLPSDKKEMVGLTAALLRAQHRIVPPSPFKPRATAPPPETRRFLEKWKITDAWRQTRHFTRVLELLEQRKVRRFLEVCLLGPLTNDTIVQHGQAFFGNEVLDLGVVRAFLHYFWNVHEVSRPQWRRIAGNWTQASNDYFVAMLSPPSLAGVRITLQAAGVPVTIGDIEALEAIKDAFMSKSLNHLMTEYPKFGDTQGALLAFQGAILAEERLDILRGGTSALLSKLDMIQTKYDDRALEAVQSAPMLIEGHGQEIEDEPGTGTGAGTSGSDVGEPEDGDS